jgi:hypothetical protein
MDRSIAVSPSKNSLPNSNKSIINASVSGNSEASPSERLVTSFLRGFVCPHLEYLDASKAADPQLTRRCSQPDAQSASESPKRDTSGPSKSEDRFTARPQPERTGGSGLSMPADLLPIGV